MFTSTTNSSIVKQSRVIGVDNVARTISVKFGGAPSGFYKVTILHSAYGAFDTNSLTLETAGKVTNYSPA